jgi:NADH:ubiquinone oxidoreductase subunit 6 (subunit J)
LNLVLFYLLAAIIVISAFLVVTLRNVFHSALFLVLTFFMVAGIYLMLSAQFLAAVQVLIYVGAITILILFVIMLTQQIQSKSIRQANEQVIPAALISIVFLIMAIFAMTRSFGGNHEFKAASGVWTASIEAKKLAAESDRWNWTVSLEDKDGKNYIAVGTIYVMPRARKIELQRVSPADRAESPSGYVLSPRADFSLSNNLFGENETIYLKAWSDKLDYLSIKNAVWKLTSNSENNKVITEPLINDNPGTIGQLLMSKFVLPFEIVSVLLLVALMGAIVISRKDK